MVKFATIIPTLNAGKQLETLLTSLNNQTCQSTDCCIIDSESSDNTVKIIKKFSYRHITILQNDFSHGGTRQMGAELYPDVEIVIFLTQDAILADEFSIENILKCFEDDEVGAAYGRQMPHLESGAISAHARTFNYSETSMIKSFSDSKRLGIKTAFISNSFAAYRMEALLTVGGFPKHTILSEETYVASKMLLSGWKIQYCADAKVYHSHDYTYIQEFKRYFDIGVFHAREPWIRDKFGQAEGEGLRFVLSEAKYLLKKGKGYLLPSSFIRTCLKYLGYRLGAIEQQIPLNMKKHLSMHRRYWNK